MINIKILRDICDGKMESEADQGMKHRSVLIFERRQRYRQSPPNSKRQNIFSDNDTSLETTLRVSDS